MINTFAKFVWRLLTMSKSLIRRSLLPCEECGKATLRRTRCRKCNKLLCIRCIGYTHFHPQGKQVQDVHRSTP